MTAQPSIHDAIASIHEPTAQFITNNTGAKLMTQPLDFLSLV